MAGAAEQARRLGMALQIGAGVGVAVLASAGYGYVVAVGAAAPPIVADRTVVTVLRAVAIGWALLALVYLPRIGAWIDRQPTASAAPEQLELQRYLRHCVVVLAVADGPAMIGFVLAFVANEAWDALAFGAAALVLLAAHFPRFESWKSRQGSDASG